MPYYHTRITLDITSQKYIQFARERTTKFILVLENADVDCKQPHLHLHCEALHKNEQAFRREFKEWFPDIHGNKDYSLKSCNAMGYNYVSKGENSDWDLGAPDVLATTFDIADIKEFHRMYWVHKERVIVNLADDDIYEPKKPPKKKRPNWTQEVIHEIQIEHPDRLFDSDDLTDRTYIINKLLSRMGQTGKALDAFIMIRLFNAVYNALNKSERCHQNFVARIDFAIVGHWVKR